MTGGSRKRFTGHERDVQSGLDYMLARYYGANLGRFLSVDPVVKRRKNSLFPQRWNRYAYSLNNPIKYFDPNGEDVELSPGFQSLISGGSKQFRQAWSAFLESTAGGDLFRNLDSNSEILVTVRVQTDAHFDDDGDGVGDAYGSATMLDSEAKSQVIDLNFENTGGTAELADTMLEEFVHVSENVDCECQSPTVQDHEAKERLKEETGFDEEVNEHIEKDNQEPKSDS